jgi:hypothetical protein
MRPRRATTSPDGVADAPPRPRRRRTLAGAVVAVAIASGVVGVGAVAAAPPTDDPATAAEYGARWLAARYDPEGFVPNPVGDPSVGATLQDTLALASAGVEEATFDQAMTWLQANVDTVIDSPSGDDPGRLGYLMLLADAAGIDPTAFGGADLPALLLATEGDFEPGLFGAADPTFDGAFRQSIAIVGLVASGTAVPASAVDWLADQQCGAATPASEGAWQSYRADPTQPCDPPDPINFTGPDTNATSVAIWALEETGTAGTADALDFLEAGQDADGGFAYIPGGDVDPNSTALVILAIRAGGEDPSAGRWVEGTATPYTSLLSWQVGCDAAVADRGGFASPFSAGAPDPGATGQATWGAAGNTFPLGEVTFTTAAVPCVPPTTTTSTTAPTSSSTTAAPTTTVVGSSPAQAVVVQPRLAG